MAALYMNREYKSERGRLRTKSSSVWSIYCNCPSFFLLHHATHIRNICKINDVCVVEQTFLLAKEIKGNKLDFREKNLKDKSRFELLENAHAYYYYCQ